MLRICSVSQPLRVNCTNGGWEDLPTLGGTICLPNGSALVALLVDVIRSSDNGKAA